MRTPIVALAALLLALAAGSQVALALHNGVALTPPLGWSSWNPLGCGVNETRIRRAADALVGSGLAAAGYISVNIDDCWQGFRDSGGRMIADQQSFPSGMGKVGSYLHALGLQFGLSSSAGSTTCQGRPGSLGFEEMDAISFAMWGVDFLKYDDCGAADVPAKRLFPPMRDALNHTERHVVYSIGASGETTPALWAPEVANAWRTTSSAVRDEWDSMLQAIDANDEGWKSAASGAWNDPGELQVGRGGMSLTEYQSHFSLWALAKAPLLLGCDVSKLDEETLGVLTHPEVLGVHQDVLGVQGHKILPNPAGVELWGGALNGTSFVALLLNRGAADASYSFDFSALGAPPCNHVRDLWAREDLGAMQTAYTTPSVAAHGVQMLKLTPCEDPKRIAIAFE